MCNTDYCNNGQNPTPTPNQATTHPETIGELTGSAPLILETPEGVFGVQLELALEPKGGGDNGS